MEQGDDIKFFERAGWISYGIGVSAESPPMHENELWIQVLSKESPQTYVNFLKKISSLEELEGEIDQVRSRVDQFNVFTPVKKHITDNELIWQL